MDNHSQTPATMPVDLYALPPGTLLTEQQLADALQISVKTIQAWRTRRTGPTSRSLGTLIRYRTADVTDWIDSNG